MTSVFLAFGVKSKLIEFCIETIESLADVSLFSNQACQFGDIVSSAIGSGAFDFLRGAGEALLVCFFLIFFVESAIRDHHDPDALFKELALLCLYSAILTNLPMVVTSLSEFGQEIVTGIVNSGGLDAAGSADVSSTVAKIKDKLNDLNIFALCFQVVIYFIFGNIMKFVIQIVAYIALFTVKVELFIRTVAMPLAVALIADDGWKGPGGRYIKKWVGCFVQMGIISIATQSYTFVTGLTVGSVDMFPALIAAGLAVAGICMKSGQLASDVVGG
jgi:hypothetical protein